MSTLKPDTKILERVRKLLRMAAPDSGASEAEVNFAAARAAEIMEEHGLSTMMVEASGGEGEQRSKESSELAFGAWYGPLMQAVSESCFVMCDVLEDKKRKRVRFSLIGRTSAVITAQLTFDYLRAAIWRLSREASVQSPRFFRHGCAERVIERLRARHAAKLREQQEEAERAAREQAARAAHPGAAGSSTALVVTLVDYAQREAHLNEDMRRGVPPGTTQREHEESRALAEQRSRRVRELREQGVPDGVAWNMVYLKMDLAAAEAYERQYLEQAAKIQAAEAKRQKKWQSSNRSYDSREDRKRASTSFRAGAAAGEHVGLDQQIGNKKQRRLS